MDNSKEPQLIRKGNNASDPLRERVVTNFQPPRDQKGVVPIPKFFTSESYIYPIGALPGPIDIEGKPIEVRIRESGEVIPVQPELRIIGAKGEKGGRKLVDILYLHYESQIQGIRIRLDGLFRTALGNNPAGNELSALAQSGTAAYSKLQEDIGNELGLEVEWTLQPGAKVGEWLSKLIQACPWKTTLTYNEELPVTKFSLDFSITVVRPEPRRLNRLMGRYRENLPPKEELKRIAERVHEITNPAFSKTLTGINQWNVALIQELAEDGFQKAVSKRLADEFGVEVSFADFRPAPNEKWIQIAGETSRETAARKAVKNAELVYDRFLTLQAEAAENSESMAVIEKLDNELERAKQRMENAHENLRKAIQERPETPRGLEERTVNEFKSEFRGTVLGAKQLESKTDTVDTPEA